MKRGMIRCPVCGKYADLRIRLGFWGSFTCVECGSKGGGIVRPTKNDGPAKNDAVNALYPPQKDDGNGHT